MSVGILITNSNIDAHKLFLTVNRRQLFVQFFDSQWTYDPTIFAEVTNVLRYFILNELLN